MLFTQSRPKTSHDPQKPVLNQVANEKAPTGWCWGQLLIWEYYTLNPFCEDCTTVFTAVVVLEARLRRI